MIALKNILKSLLKLSPFTMGIEALSDTESFSDITHAIAWTIASASLMALFPLYRAVSSLGPILNIVHLDDIYDTDVINIISRLLDQALEPSLRAITPSIPPGDSYGSVHTRDPPTFVSPSVFSQIHTSVTRCANTYSVTFSTNHGRHAFTIEHASEDIVDSQIVAAGHTRGSPISAATLMKDDCLFVVIP